MSIENVEAPVTITRSTISTNSATGNTATADGGGLVIINNAVTTIINSTISGNSAGDQGGGLFSVVNAGQTLTIRHSTIANNTSDSDSSTAGSGGGIFFGTGTGVVAIEHTIVAGNFDNSATNAEDIHNPAGGPTITSKFNLIGVDTGGHGSPMVLWAIKSATAATPRNPLLGPLAFNGGLTQTHALLFGSPAIDTGENPAASDHPGDGSARRRFPRASSTATTTGT